MTRTHSRTGALALIAALAACGTDNPQDTRDAAAEPVLADPDAALPESDAGAPDPLRVRIAGGEIEGVALDGDVRAFLGIPYAKPPLGALRFRAPEPPAPWSDVRRTKDYGPRCAQLASATLQSEASDDEDCLYLNVWSAADSADAKLPVMVWIHGGGNVTGSASEPLPFVKTGRFYAGEHLAGRGVVVVSFNYRLGALGFFAHPALEAAGAAPGNQGLLDQQQALRWVRDNVARFGGDPSNVTIFGESAGALDVCLHVVAEESRGLFHKAISQSGGCATRQPTLDEAHARAATLAEALGCTGDDVPACLAAKSAHDVVAAASESDAAARFAPIVDGAFLTDQPRSLFERGEAAEVPYMLGSNSDEGTLFVTGLSGVDSDAAYRQIVAQRVGEDFADRVLAAYPASDYADAPKPYQAALARVFGDQALVCTTHDVALRSAASGAPTWLYNFDIPANFGNLGATHGAELAYVFGTGTTFSDAQRAASEQMQVLWTSFAKTGAPGGAGSPSWPPFSAAADVRLNIGLSFETRTDFRAEECALWRSFYDARFTAP
jgi:para-nitrobenzyl esterase